MTVSNWWSRLTLLARDYCYGRYYYIYENSAFICQTCCNCTTDITLCGTWSLFAFRYIIPLNQQYALFSRLLLWYLLETSRNCLHHHFASLLLASKFLLEMATNYCRKQQQQKQKHYQFVAWWLFNKYTAN